MRCIAIDDEPFALGILKEFCRRADDMEICCFSNPVEGMEAVQAERPDILFLDIEMGGVSGLELAGMIPEGTSLIFTTAYAKYAIDGFELEAVDFLHKPFSFQRFERAVAKVSDLMRMRRISSEAEPSGPVLPVMSGYRRVNVPAGEILFVESFGNYIHIHMTDGRKIPALMRMKDILSMLPDGEFARIHKSYIIPLKKVRSRSGREVVLNGGKVLPVGRAYSSALDTGCCFL